MDGDGIVEILFRCAHFHRHGEALQHFVRAATDDVHADDFFIRADTHQLHGGTRAVFGQRVVHVGKARGINLDRVAVNLARLVLAEAHGANGRMREHHGGDVLVFQSALGLIVEQAIPEAASRGDGHRRQRRATGDIAHRVDAGDVGVLEFVRGDDAAGLERHAGRLEIEIQRRRGAADGPDEGVEVIEADAALAVDVQQAVFGFPDLPDVDAGDDVDAGIDHFFHEGVAQEGVEVAQKMRPAQQHGDLAAQRVEQAGQFHGDVPGAHHRHALRALGQLEEAVGGDAVLGAGHVGHGGKAAGGDDDVIGADLFAIHVEGPGIDETRTAPHVIDAVVLEVVDVPVIDTFYIFLPAFHQLLPVEAVDRDVEAVAGGVVVQHVGHVGGIPHDLLRHAAHVDAGAAELLVFHHRALRAVLGGTLGHREAAAAGADGNEIVMFSHVPS